MIFHLSTIIFFLSEARLSNNHFPTREELLSRRLPIEQLRDKPLKIDFCEDVCRFYSLSFKYIVHIINHITISANITQSIGTYWVFFEPMSHTSIKITPLFTRHTRDIT